MFISLVSAVLSTACGTGTPNLFDDEIIHAITMITTELASRHDETLCWEPKNGSGGWLTKYYGGTTALTTLAMISAGQSITSPSIRTSLHFLETIESPSTYVLATRTSIWTMMPHRYKKNLKNDTKRLIDTMGLRAGSWGNYEHPPSTRNSASPLNREFGMIALREAERIGERIPKKCWIALANATLLTQQKNGGWSYQQGSTSGKSTANMTVAALNCLLGVDEMQGDKLAKKDAAWIHHSIEQAIFWLNKHATTSKNVGGTTLMSYLYGLERAAMSCGLAEINNRNWFQDGAKAVIETHCGVRKARGSTVNLAFALLFLSRGRLPIALCELATNKGIVDPIRSSEKIASRVSRHVELNLAWLLVTNDDHINSWLSAPYLFIQDVSAIPKDLSKLKQYLDSGGLIVMLGSKIDFKTFSSIAKTLCPDIKEQKVTQSHWSLSLLNKVRSVKISAWHDGIRDRVLVINESPKKLRSSKSKVLQVLVNISCGVAELNHWKPRVKKPLTAQSKKTILVAQHDGNWGLELQGLYLWKVKTKPIEEISEKTLVLVGGLHENEATKFLAEQVVRVAVAGSTVLVESIGGQHDFASKLQEIIEHNQDLTFSVDTRLQHLTGQRGWTMFNRIQMNKPQRANVKNGDIIIVNCDLRNALIQQTAWGVHGYDSKAAVQLIELLLND